MIKGRPEERSTRGRECTGIGVTGSRAEVSSEGGATLKGEEFVLGRDRRKVR